MLRCISDKETGFRHAIMVWRLMLNRRYVVINETHFAQLLWASRDCGAGDVDFYRDILLACMSVSDARKHGQMLLEAMEPNQVLIEGEDGRRLEEEVFVRKVRAFVSPPLQARG